MVNSPMTASENLESTHHGEKHKFTTVHVFLCHSLDPPSMPSNAFFSFQALHSGQFSGSWQVLTQPLVLGTSQI